jgi:hypothetical protein
MKKKTKSFASDEGTQKEKSERQTSTPHDAAYKNVFSHPVMIESLIRGFVSAEWASRLKFSSLEMVDSEYISDALVQRSKRRRLALQTQ